MTAATRTTAILVRHGETEWNRLRRIQGHSDSALTELGERQAALLAGRLAETRLDAVYSSDLSRALRTAEAIAAPHGLQPIANSHLRERGFGRWEGLTLDEAGADDAAALDMWRHDLGSFRPPGRPAWGGLSSPPGAESSEEMQQRAWEAFQRIVRRHAGQCIAIVTHSGPIRRILAAAFEIPWTESRRLHIGNGSLTTLQVEGESITLVTFNDTCHLEGGA